MLRPEEDFATWTMIMVSIIDWPPDFEPFIPDIERLCDSIRETGELPEAIKDNKVDFLTNVCGTVTRRFLNMGSLDKESIEVVQRFLELILKFCVYGIQSKNEMISRWCSEILAPGTQKLYSSTTTAELRLSLCGKAVENGCFEAAKAAMKETDQVSMLQIAYAIVMACLPVGDLANQFWELTGTMLETLHKLCKEDLRKVSVNVMKSLCDHSVGLATEKEALQKEFVNAWLDIFEMCISSEFFEKRLFGFTSLQGFVLKEKMMEVVVEWFKDEKRLNLLSGSNLHRELIAPMASVLSVLSSKGLLTNEFLSGLWEQHKFQHETQLGEFYSIFTQIATTLPVEQINDFTKMCLNPSEVSDVWIKFISDLAGALGIRKDSQDAYMMIRDRLFEYALTENPHESAGILYLGQMLHHYLNPETFDQLLDRLSQNGITYMTFRLLLSPTAVCPFNSKEQAVKYVSAAIDWLVSHTEDRDTIYGFIFNVCSKSEVSIPEDKLTALFSLCTTCSYFYTFATKIVEAGLCSFEFLENFITQYSPDLINYDFFLLVRAFVFKVNEIKEFGPFTSLPINKEEVIWDLACKKSSENLSFAQMLCEFYAHNDGVTLTDLQMINVFISTWLCYSEKEQTEKDCLLGLMRCFIQRIEENIDVSLFGVKRHGEESEKALITVSVRAKQQLQKFTAPGSMTIGAAKHRISRMFMIPRRQFNLCCGSSCPKPVEPLQQVARGQKELNLYVQTLPEESFLPEEHERSTIPSLVIPQTKVIDFAVEMLRQNHEEAKKLLQFLPTVPGVVFLIEELSKKRQFCYKELLPIDYPALFEYNLEALQHGFNDSRREDMEKSDGFGYLIDSISETIAPVVIPFLTDTMNVELKLKHGQRVLDSMLPLAERLTSLEKKEVFGKVVGFMRILAMFKDSNMVLKESMYGFVETLLLSSQGHVKSESSSLFAHVKIPLSVFAGLLDKVTQENEAEFFLALVPHVTEYDDVITNYCMEHLESTSALTVLEKMLSLNLLPDDRKEALTIQLITEYLCVDEKPKDKACFTMAAKCLAHMENEILLNHIQGLHAGRNVYLEWRIDGDASYVSKSGYSGLVNMGATCFLNSTLQQFFAIVPLRNKILEYSGTDPFMLELRNLFAKMLLSKGHSVTVKDLVEKWVGWDGEPMNPRIQQDACEFVEMLLDKLETGLDRDMIKKMFGGTTVNTFDGIEEQYHSTSSHPNYTLVLPMPGCKDMASAFEKFQAVDYFTGSDGYEAKELGRKIDVKKYESLGVLPECLIVQLGRFEYNYQLGTRKKIDTPFDFPLEADLEKYVAAENKGQETKYVLKGVIVHSGTAQYGHYTSYIQDRKGEKKWYLFNDAHVTEVAEKDMYQAAAGKASGTNGYLLFYERVDFQDIDDGHHPAISQELQDKIVNDNKLNDEYRLYCSSAYFEFMKLLAKSKDPKFLQVAIQYYFDSFPFTTHIRDAEVIGSSLVEALANNDVLRKTFAEFLSQGPFACALVYCPQSKVRTHALDMFKTLNPDELSEHFLERLWLVMSDGLIDYWNDFNEYFELIDWLVTNGQRNRSYAEGHGWGHGLCHFFSQTIPDFLQNKGSKLRPGYFYEGVCLSGIFKAISHLCTPPEFVDNVLTKQTFEHILASRSTSIQAIQLLLLAFPDTELVKEFVRDFAVSYGIHVNYFRLLALLFDILQGEAFDVLDKCHLKVADKSASDFDLTCAIASHLVDVSEFATVLLNNLNKWFLKLILNTEVDVTVACRHVVALMIPHEEFKTLIEFPRHDYARLFNKISMDSVQKQSDEVMRERANRILDFITADVQPIVSTMTADANVNAHGFVELVGILASIATRDVCPFMLTMAEAVLNHVEPLSPKIRDVVRYILSQKPDLISTDFLVKCFPEELKAGDLAAGHRMIAFYDAISGIADRFSPPEAFVTTFMKNVAFPAKPLLVKFAVIEIFIKRFASLYPELFRSYIKENFDTVVAKNYSALIVTLETIGDKMPIVNHLPMAANGNQYFAINPLVQKSFALNDGEINAVIEIAGILNTPELEESTRELIWSVIFAKMPSLTDLETTYTWRGDWVNLTKYLLKLNTPTDTHVIERLVDCAQNSIDAFSLSFTWLKDNAKEAIIAPSFSSIVLKLDIGDHSALIEQYLLLATENKNEAQIEEVMLPLLTTVLMRVKFLNEVLDDVADNGITKDDILPLFGPLRVFGSLHMGTRTIIQDLGRLKYNCERDEVLARLHLPELSDLVALLRKVILV